jgi:adenylate kinase family enzyme
MKTLYLVRGPSGSGKSTIAGAIVKKTGLFTPILETDNFWGTDYAFKVDMLSDAHAWCRLEVMRFMVSCRENIIVSNTFTKHWEMKAYFDLAERFGYKVEVIRSPKPWEAAELFERGVQRGRNTPIATIHRHIDNYQPREDETEWTDLSIFG